MDTCKAFLDRLQRGAAPWVVQRLSSTYGTMPTDPGLFSFWVALVLPIDDREKAKLLPIKSARLRLMMVVHWIDQLNSKWYVVNFFGGVGCDDRILLSGGFQVVVQFCKLPPFFVVFFFFILCYRLFLCYARMYYTSPTPTFTSISIYTFKV